MYLGAGQDRWITEGTGSFQHNVLGVGKRTAGASTDYFTRDEGGRLVSRRSGATRHYYLTDALGSVTGLTDSTGAVTARYDYEPYGTPAPRSAGQWGATTNAADVANGQFGFAAGYRSVGGLYHFGQRYYDPVDMRWTQPDPLDQTGDLRQGNRYAYAGADPVNLSDPQGTHYKGSGSVGGSDVPLVPCDDGHYEARYASCRGPQDNFDRAVCWAVGGASVASDAVDYARNVARRPSLPTIIGAAACLL